MKAPTLLLGTLWMVTQAVAAVVTYPELNVNYSPAAGSSLSTGAVLIDAAHTYTDPDVDPGVASATRYYGGSINFTAAGSDWGWQGQVILDDASLGSRFEFEVGAGWSDWRLEGYAITPAANGLLPAASSFDYVIKISDGGYNTSQISLFLGSAANTLTEGSPTLVRTFADTPSAMNFSTIEVRASRENWSTEFVNLQTSKMFSSTEWTPVSAIPEPSTYAAALGLCVLAFVGYRRRS